MSARHKFLAICILLSSSACTSQNPRPVHRQDVADSEPSGSSELTEAPKISLNEAIALARKRVPGARFLHAEFGREGSRADCLVAFWGAEGLRVLYVDASTGEILNEATPKLESAMAAQLRNAAEHAASSIEPSRAIEIALATTPGSWARLIDLESDADPLAWQLEIVKGEEVWDVRLLGADGALLSRRPPSDD